MENGKHIENFFYYIIFVATDLVLIELWQIICWIVASVCVWVYEIVYLLEMIVKNEKKKKMELWKLWKLWKLGEESPLRCALCETFNCFASTFAAHVVNRIFQFENAVNC